MMELLVLYADKEDCPNTEENFLTRVSTVRGREGRLLLDTGKTFVP